VSRCAECAGRRLAFTTARAAIVYDEIGRVLVRAWKELGRRDLSEPLASVVVASITRPDVDVVTYVPGDRERGLVRGHVPAAGLAAALARRWGLECEPLLEREHRGTKRQAELPRDERAGNVRHAFRARAHAPPAVCLVDDIYTTGSTVNACARALRTAGARRTIAVCLARAVR
jgi:predicted amidophosphoribosyltransferase